MRHRSEVSVSLAVSAFALAGVSAIALGEAEPIVMITPTDPVMITPIGPEPIIVVRSTDDADAWFQSIRQFCNPVEVETRMRWQPSPETPEGDMHRAACYALAGRIERARGVIQGLPQELQYSAAGVVFNAGHPAADAGDDVAAGPLMELVVEFWPNHYMALYHAGAASFERGDYGLSVDYLERFLVEYSVEDGWRSSATSMLEDMSRMER